METRCRLLWAPSLVLVVAALGLIGGCSRTSGGASPKGIESSTTTMAGHTSGVGGRKPLPAAQEQGVVRRGCDSTPSVIAAVTKAAQNGGMHALLAGSWSNVAQMTVAANDPKYSKLAADARILVSATIKAVQTKTNITEVEYAAAQIESECKQLDISSGS